MVANLENMDDSSNTISNFVNFVAGGTCSYSKQCTSSI